MKAELIVVQGKPEGKVIPMTGPLFRIGRGEACHLRPNSELISREHVEFAVSTEGVTVRDLGSRNGTLVNGKPLTELYRLNDRDLVQVGKLTFAVSIQGVAAADARPSSAGVAKGSPEDVSHDDIGGWLVGDGKNPAPDRPSGVYGGETMTINTYQGTAATPAAAPAKPAAVAPAAAAPAKPAAVAPAAAAPATPAPVADRVEQEEEPLDDEQTEDEETEEDQDEESGESDEMPDEMMDESNPFYVKKKPAPEATPSKPKYEDTSDAASDILRKLMERRRAR